MYKEITGDCPKQKNASIIVYYNDASTCKNSIFIRNRFDCKNFECNIANSCPLLEKAPIQIVKPR